MKLRKELPERIRRAAESHVDQEFWSVIRGKLPRTRLIVRDLQRLLEGADQGGLDQVMIRIVAGLGALATSDHEPEDPSIDNDYRTQILAERNLLRSALARGARLKAVLNPQRRFTQAMLPRLRVRFARLIGLLEGRSDIEGDPQAVSDDLVAIRRCELVLSPVPMPNLLVIGERVAYEGWKRGGTRGFEMTHCETNRDSVRELVQQFDNHFEDSLREMVLTHPPDGRLLDQLKSIYREAVTGAENPGPDRV